MTDGRTDSAVAHAGAVREGLNAKLKFTLKRSYGFRIDLARKVALYHAFAKLP